MNKENHNCFNINQTKEHIQKFGFSVIVVKASDYFPSFAYSVGLSKTFNHPEIICFGLNIELMHALINDVAEIIKSDGKINYELEYNNIFAHNRAKFLKVDKQNIEDYLKVAIRLFDTKEIECLQLIWTDRNNRFPWEDNFEKSFKFKQPLLDRNTKFKFLEDENLGIFTTKQWLENNDPILRVLHEKDGDWQFLTENIDFENGKIVALKEMVKRDITLNEIFDLDYGEIAERKFIGDNWVITKI